MVDNNNTNHRLRNLAQTVLFFTGMFLLLALLGWSLGGASGLIWASIFGGLFLYFSARVPTRLVLRMAGARSLSPAEAPGLYRIVEALARRADLPAVPKLYYLSSPMMNALTVGDGRTAAIGITQGLLRNLNTRELTGVLAHEVSHIQNKDTQVMRIASIISRVTGMLAFFGQLLLFFNLPLLLLGRVTISWLAILLLLAAPTLSSLLQMALSRAREYDADIGAARLTGDPEGLASALYKMEQAQGGILRRLFGRSGSSGTDLFRTHPHTKERVSRLVALSGPFQAAPIGNPGELVTWDRPQPRIRWPWGWYTIKF